MIRYLCNNDKSRRNIGKIIKIRTILLISIYFIVETGSMSIALFNQIQSSPHSSDCSDGLQIYLTVSSIAKTRKSRLEDRLIELNWHDARSEPGDWVGLFDHFPHEESIDDPLYKSNVSLEKGYIKTEFRLGRDPLVMGQNPCLGYWIAYIRNGDILMTNCLRIYPKWMQESKDIIGDIPLHSLMLPGTHNSGSWKEYDGPNSDTVFLRYLINQDESVYNQLMHGIRYLDLRVGYYSSGSGVGEKFWVNHNFYRMRPLSSVLSDIKKFLEESSEIVVLDFHRFPVGFDGKRERHAQLVKFINESLEEFSVPSSFWPNATPNELWRANRTLIISYADTRTAQEHTNLWPPLTQEWGDKRSLSELKSFLLEAVKRRGGKDTLWAAMAEFTPKPLDIILSPNKGLRNMAQKVNEHLTNWVLGDKELYTKSNIIATDFFLGNNIVQTAINSNYKRAKCI